MAMFRSTRVIVGVNGSQHSLGVVRRALAEAGQRDALLVPVIAWMASDGDSLRPLSELQHSARRRLDTVLELAFDGVPEGVRMHPLVLRAEAGRALVATADRADDLLVVGGGQLGGARQVVHGSVTRHCWTHAACEVLIVPRSPSPQLLDPALLDPQLLDEGPRDSGPHCHAGVGYLN
jgi:nucleotide-binding universal stress UspA family protein